MKIKNKFVTMSAAVIVGAVALVPLAHSSCTSGTSSDGKFFTVAQSQVANTDFTKAAESTIDCVVSIKSYVKPRTVKRQRYQGFDPFDDPFLNTSSEGRHAVSRRRLPTTLVEMTRKSLPTSSLASARA